MDKLNERWYSLAEKLSVEVEGALKEQKVSPAIAEIIKNAVSLVSATLMCSPQ